MDAHFQVECVEMSRFFKALQAQDLYLVVEEVSALREISWTFDKLRGVKMCGPRKN